MPEEKPRNIREIITKIEAADFTFSKFAPEYFAPAPDKSGEGGGAAFIAAGIKDARGRWKRRIKITQLRKLFAEIKRLEVSLKGREDSEPLDKNFYDRLWLLHPELAYAKGRNLIDDDFFILLKIALSTKKLKEVGDFRRFSQFITAILAYSKYLEE